MADIDYYNDEAQWGSYQYVTLESIINNYIMSLMADDYTNNAQRFQILYQARRAFKELYYDVVQEIRGIELDLSPQLRVTLPPDYISWVRISWVDERGLLHPMAEDKRISIANEYLQDNDFALLFDDDGCVLIGDNIPDTGAELSSGNANSDFGGSYSYTINRDSFHPNKNLGNVYSNGKFTIDKDNGYIQFGSDSEGKSVVVEYVSDGLYTGCEGKPESELRINKFAETPVIDYIYYQLVKNRRNVPANEKARARKEYYNSRRIAKARINSIKRSELIQAFRGSSKWIKQ
jgi:hypothetical protein